MSIADITPSELKRNLRDRIIRALIIRREISAKAGELTQLGVNFKLKSSADVVDDVLKAWVRDLEDGATNESCGETNARVELLYDMDIEFPWRVPDGMAPYGARRELRFEWHHNAHSHNDDIRLVDELLRPVDFSALILAISRKSAELREIGMQKAAKDLARFLRVDGSTSPTEPKVIGQSYVFSGFMIESRGSCSPDSLAAIENAVPALEAVEANEDLPCISEVLSGVLSYLSSVSVLEKVPSRKTLGSPETIQTTFFKKKIQFKMPLRTFDTLIAFIVEWGDVELTPVDRAA